MYEKDIQSINQLSNELMEQYMNSSIVYMEIASVVFINRNFYKMERSIN